MKLGSIAIAALFIFGGCGQCGSEGESPAGEASAKLDVKDVVQACEKRKSWKRAYKEKCIQCVGLASAPACGCPKDQKAFSGQCAREQAKKNTTDACRPTWDCTYKCKKDDCECRAKCFEGQDECRGIASALEGCLVQVCDPYCS